MASNKNDKLARDADNSRPQRQQPSRNNTENDNVSIEGISSSEYNPTQSATMIVRRSSVRRSRFADKRGTVQTDQGKLKSQPCPRVRQRAISESPRTAVSTKRTTSEPTETTRGARIRPEPTRPRLTRTVLEPTTVMIITRPKPESIWTSCYFPNIQNTIASSKKPSGNQTTTRKSYIPRPVRIPSTTSRSLATITTSHNFQENNLGTRVAITVMSETTIKKYNFPLVTCSTRGVRTTCTYNPGSQISTRPPFFPRFEHRAKMSTGDNIISILKVSDASMHTHGLTGGRIMSVLKVFDTSTNADATTAKFNPTIIPSRLFPLVTNPSMRPRATTHVVDSLKSPLTTSSESSPSNKNITEVVSAESIRCEPSTNLLYEYEIRKPSRFLRKLMEPRRLFQSPDTPEIEVLDTTSLSILDMSLTPAREAVAPQNILTDEKNEEKKPSRFLRKSKDPRRVFPSPDAPTMFRRKPMESRRFFPSSDDRTTEILETTILSILDMSITPAREAVEPSNIPKEEKNEEKKPSRFLRYPKEPRQFFPPPDAQTSEILETTNLSILDMSITPAREAVTSSNIPKEEKNEEKKPRFLRKSKEPRRFFPSPDAPTMFRRKPMEPRRFFASPDTPLTKVLAPTNIPILDMPITSARLLRKPLEPIVLNLQRLIMTGTPSLSTPARDAVTQPNLSLTNIPKKHSRFLRKLMEPRRLFQSPDAPITNLTILDMPITPARLLRKPLEPIVLSPRRIDTNNDIQLPVQSVQERLESFLSSVQRQLDRHDEDESDTD